MVKNMKSGFTMIELIFVIVILGILAAVALPKFVGMGNQAHVSNLESFQGSLNRTVSPTVWAKVATTHKGDLSKLGADEQKLSIYTDIPQEFKDTKSTDANLSNLGTTDSDPGTDILGHDISSECSGATIYRLKVPGGDDAADFNASIGDGDNKKTYVVDFCNGTQTSAPKYFVKEK